jgi:hypothetical protein
MWLGGVAKLRGKRRLRRPRRRRENNIKTDIRDTDLEVDRTGSGLNDPGSILDRGRTFRHNVQTAPDIHLVPPKGTE